MKITKNKPLRFGLIGHGRIGRRYVEELKKNPLTQLIAVAETNLKRRRQAAEYDTYRDYKKILGRDDIDIVVVATPNASHAQMAIDALKADKHVICEKPMTTSLSDANKLVLTAERSSSKLFVVKQNRFNPPVQKVKELIDANKLGKIGMVVVNCYWNRNDDYYKSSDWKGKLALDGGTLYTQFSHFVDIVYFLLGEFATVQAIGTNFTHKKLIEFEDTGVVSFTLESGALGSINYTTSAFQQNMEGSITLFGEKGTVKIGGQYLNELEYFKVKNMRKVTLAKGNTANDYGTYKGSMSNHDKVIENVVLTLRGKATLTTTGFEGLRIVRVIEKMYRSMKSGRLFEVN